MKRSTVAKYCSLFNGRAFLGRELRSNGRGGLHIPRCAGWQFHAVSCTRTAKFSFADFGLTQPRVPIVLSVAETIALEYDFKLLRAKTAK